MPILRLSLGLLFFSSAFACEISPSTTIYSLSGPVTVMLQELKLMESPQLKGISIFHPVSNFKREVLPGGVFLGHSLLEKLQGNVVFFDESQQLVKTFRSKPSIQAIELKTRGLGPQAVTEKVFSLLRPFLKNCEEELKTIELKQTERLKYLAQLANKKSMVFFLGRITDRFPDLVMANDGVVKWLVVEKKLTTYPTELAYVSWSAKVLEGMPTSLKIGLNDSAQRGEKKFVKAEKGSNLTWPGVLIPGISQVEGFIYLFESISSRP